MADEVIGQTKVHIQWKGTDVCMDAYCKCGRQSHFDGDFAYSIRCPHCDRVYKMPSDLILIDEIGPESDLYESAKLLEP